jgi:hypothetical protein
MSMKAIKDLYKKVNGFVPAARTATNNGTGVDLANVIENEFVYQTGAYTDGTHTPKLQESDDNSAFTDVAAADQVGTLAAVSSSAGQNAFQAVSYIGSKRYCRMVLTRSGTTTGIVDASFANLKYRKQP